MALEDRTEAPTQRRRTEAREDGQVARSLELNSALILIAGLLLIKLTGPQVIERLQGMAINSLGNFPKHDLATGEVCSYLARILLDTATAIAPLVLGIMVVGFAANVLQVGLVFSGKPLMIKAERFNVIAGIGRMFSARSAVELLKALVKIVIISYIVYSFLRDRYADIASLMGGSYQTTCLAIGQLTWELLLRSAMALFIIAALDYMYQKMQLEKQLRMTKQEVKDDTKRSDGDPQVKGKIRQRQREVAQRRMMHEVPKADVVIANPTHFAVALKYDPEQSQAPIVVAKGQDLIAQQIKRIAEENNVPIVENVQLARALYASAEIGDEIPADLYQAVAEILAYVFKLSKKLAP